MSSISTNKHRLCYFMTGKIIKKDELKKHIFEEEIMDFLAKKYKAFALVTCSQENEKGKMKAELKHEGDEGLVAYLLEGALEAFQEKEKIQDLL